MGSWGLALVDEEDTNWDLALVDEEGIKAGSNFYSLYIMTMRAHGGCITVAPFFIHSWYLFHLCWKKIEDFINIFIKSCFF